MSTQKVNRLMTGLLVAIALMSPIYGMAEIPNPQENKEIVNENMYEELAEVPTENALSDQELHKNRQKTERLIKQKQFNKILDQINQIPTDSRFVNETKMKESILMFQEIEKLEALNNKLFKKDESMNEDTVKSINRLYKGAQLSYLQDKYSLSKDMLIQLLFVDRKNFKAKKFLEKGHQSPVGTYKVENVEARYWKTSLINLYSGYPQKAAEDLQVLAAFDPENSQIFERMGSAYYSMGEPKKAIDSWKRALYLNPKNTDLKTFITNAEKEVQHQSKLAKEFTNRKKTQKKEKSKEVEWQLLRIVRESNQAYSYAQEVRQEMPGIEVSVEETDDGKWAVKIPKPQKK